MFYYCKRCRTAVTAKTLDNGREKVARFRSGYVARCLACGHTVSVNDPPARLLGDDSPMTPAEIAELHRIALNDTNDPDRARAAVEAYLAGRNRMIPV